MSLFVDLFGYLSVVLHGLTIATQAAALGSVLFIALLAKPLQGRIGPGGRSILRRATGTAAVAAVASVTCEAATIALQGIVLADTIDLSPLQVLGADFAIAGMVKIAAALMLAILVATRRDEPPVPALLGLGAVMLMAATLTTHAAARLDGRLPLLLASALHQFGAAIWIGGLPCFLMALRRCEDTPTLRLVAARYSRMSMIGVACVLLSAAAMTLRYIGSWAGVYGTAYGVMVGAKVGLFILLLALGGMNFLLIERLRGRPGPATLRLRRFVEVELGIGLSIFFAAASLTSVPPAIDLSGDRVTLAEIGVRNAPAWPRLTSPEHDALALPALQAELDVEAAHHAAVPAPAFIPGAGQLPPRNAADVAWSEYNHHWAGLFVLAIGVLATLNQAGLRWARHWPILFVLMAAFLFLRGDPEVWPLGTVGFFASLRDVEVLQHRVFQVLIAVFGVFEWRVRAGALQGRAAALVFPLITAVGGMLLLTHSHAVANVKEQLLIELTHTPLAILGIIAGWARWLEIRLDPAEGRIAGWVWPACFVLIGLLLLNYREA